MGSGRSQPDPILTNSAELASLRAAGLTVDEIAARAGCSVGHLRRAARRLGLPPSKPGRKPTPALAERDALAELIASGLTTGEIAQRTGCSTTVVRRWIKRHGLDFPQHRRRPTHEPQLDDADWLRREHHERGRSVGAIARELGRSRTMVTLRFHAFGIPIRKQTTYPRLRDAEWLEQQYAAGKSSRTIAREVGCSEAGVRLAALSVGVTPRARPPF